MEIKNKLGIVLALLVAFSLILFPALSLADFADDDDSEDITIVKAKTINPEIALNNLTDWFFAFVLALAVIYLVYAGFLFITAAGEPEKIGKARSAMFWGLIGVGAAVLSKGLVSLVMSILSLGQ